MTLDQAMSPKSSAPLAALINELRAHGIEHRPSPTMGKIEVWARIFRGDEDWSRWEEIDATPSAVMIWLEY